jgi:hypothetical protein
MKVKLKDLRPNPFRNVEEYVLDGEKVKRFVNSINETGFWDNVLARNNVTETNPDGEIQLAYGHHRLCALQEIYGKDLDHEIDIPVKPLSDSVMLKIMAEENNDEYGHDIRVIDQTIEAIGNWLAEHPEEARGQLHKPKVGSARTHLFVTEDGKIVGKRNIIEFLPKGNWSETKVGECIRRLKAYKEKTVDKETIQDLPDSTSAENFLSSVNKTKASKKAQKKVVKKLKEKKIAGRDKTKITAELLNEDDKKEKSKINTFLEFIRILRKDMDKVSGGLEQLIKRKAEFTQEVYIKDVKVSELIDAFDFMINKIRKVRDAYASPIKKLSEGEDK